MPSLKTAAVWATDPVRLLAVVAAAAGAAVLLALVRLISGSQGTGGDAGVPDDDEPTGASDPHPMPQPERLDARPGEEVLSEVDWDAVAASVRIEIAPDGSVTVVGIPNSVPNEYGQIIARVATAAALPR